jgi:DNA-binding transcriptional LysR family regulator
MINLEWLRTFRTVYKTGSLTRAAKQLTMTQPAVSQHIAALEMHTGNKLFVRKSKGVVPSDYARTFNNMIAHSLDDRQEVEDSLLEQTIRHEPVITMGISEHLYPCVLAGKLYQIDARVHVHFGTSEQLTKDAEEGNLHYAIVPQLVTNFDTDCYPLLQQQLILVHTPSLDLEEFESLFEQDRKKAEKWLSRQRWYSHRSVTPFIKQFWMDVFDKKRPDIVPHRVIPNEQQVLLQLSRGSGLAICFDNNAAPFLEEGSLVRSRVTCGVVRDVVLLANRKKAEDEWTKDLISTLT